MNCRVRRGFSGPGKAAGIGPLTFFSVQYDERHKPSSSDGAIFIPVKWFPAI